jgi:outer membrane immunogenic protein
MRVFVIVAAAVLAATASVAPAAAADAVVNPGPFDAPPAFPQIYSGPPPAPGEPLKAPPAYVKATIYDWTGLYIGINGGAAFGNADWSSVPDLTSGTLDVSGGLVGGTVGYNLQTGEPWVLGVELDIDWASLRGTASPASCAPGCQLNVSWLDTARVRFGWAFDGFVPGGILPYVTGGVALSELRASIIGAPFGTLEQANFAWTAGAGVEFVITGALRAKVEYLFVDQGKVTCDIACGGGPIVFNNINSNVVRAGLNYRLWMN